MKTLPLRELLRQPAKVKKLTAAGHPVRITDRDRNLWLIQPDRPESEKNPAQEDDDDAFWVATADFCSIRARIEAAGACQEAGRDGHPPAAKLDKMRKR